MKSQLQYPQLSTLVSYKTKEYCVTAIEYDSNDNSCKYHLMRDDDKIVIDVLELDVNNRYRKSENRK